MKSSGAVFTKQNPFPPASPVGKTYYHPSSIQCLSKKKKKTTLSPVRSNQRASPPLHSPSRADQRLLGKPNHLFTCLHLTADGQPCFSESWPSTDLESSPASSSMETPKQSAPAGRSTVSFDQAQQDSVLAKYIERFRHGRPQSREERQQRAYAIGEEQLPFWWMSPSSLPPGSTPTQTTDKDVILPLKDDHAPAILSPVGQCRRGSTPSPSRGSLSVLSDTSQGELDDTEILQLQERASRLLQKSDGSIPISSDGLGCSDFSSPISVDEPVRRPLFPSLMESTTAAVNASSASVQAGPSQKSSVTPSLVPHTRPEEDILFQWRLRRKMEQARVSPQSQQYSSLHRSTFSWQSPSLHQPSVSGQAHKQQQSIQPPDPSQRVTPSFITAPQPETKEAHGPCPPAIGPSSSPPFLVSSSSVSKLQTDAHVPAHMHFLCDVLPCLTQSSHRSTQQRSQTKVAPKKTQQVLGNSTDTSTEEPISKHMSSPPPASSGTTEEEWPFHHRRAERKNKEKAQTKESEKNEKRTAMSIRKQKKSTRHHIGDGDHADGPSYTNRSSSRHSRGPKKVIPWTEQPSSRNGGQKERCQGFSSESCTGDRAPPPSPIHSALGQAVSEVLFPTLDSSPVQRTPVSSDSPPYTPSAPPQSPVPPGNAQNPMEVISQLLREAEDSDEKEFEDDPLLQVLRKQRKWVKEQISEVDSMLDEFQDE